MRIEVNGEKADCVEGTSIIELLSSNGLSGDRVVVEVNGRITPKDAWAETILKEGDSVLVLSFVGGG